MRGSRRALPKQPPASGRRLPRGEPRSFPGMGAQCMRPERCSVQAEMGASPSGDRDPPLHPLSFATHLEAPMCWKALCSQGLGGLFLQGGGSPIAFVPFRPSPRF